MVMITMPRFFISSPLYLHEPILLPTDISQHIKVLRLNTNSVIILFNGDGKDYHAKIQIQSKKEIYASIVNVTENPTESNLKICLIQALSMGDRMEYTIQKSVELGVTSIQPIISERCSIRFKGERADKKRERWQTIAISACEQCHRSIIPIIHPIISFEEAICHSSDTEHHFILSLAQQNILLHKILPPPQSLSLLIGPEGGFSSQEETQALQSGFKSLSLGPRVLRTETAAVAAISALQTIWGDFGIHH